MINKKLLILLITIIITPQLVSSQIPSYLPTNGLVGYWPFNGNANDQSGNSLNGTVNGATLTTDRFGNNNSAYNFNGVDNSITVPDNVLLRPANISISCWVQSPQLTTDNCIISKTQIGTAVGEQYIIGYDLNGKANFQIKRNSSCVAGSNWQYLYTNNNVITNNVWQHLVCTYDGTTMKFYKNGILVQSYLPTAGTIDNCPGGTLNIGRYWQNQYHFNGKIDDIGIWNRALTQQEITNMYNGVNYSDTCNAVSGSLVNGLVGYWPFCGNANDQSGNGNNGTVNGATLTTDRFGNSNSAYSFDGVNDYISCINNNIPAGNSSRTFSAWFYLTPTAGYSDGYSLISYGAHTFPDGRLNDIFIKENELEFNNHMRYTLNSNPVNNNNLWHNIVVSYDNTNISSIIIYLDGVQLLTSNYNLVNLTSLNTLNTNVLFGKTIEQYASNFYFNGKIDDIGIWNRALTQQEISQLYNQNQCSTNITVTDTLIINVGQLSYTNPVTYANNITIYPNPANTQVNISFNNITDLTGGHINIINSLGQQVATTPITATGTNTSMTLNSWGGTGLYFVQIINAQGQILDIKKIILQ